MKKKKGQTFPRGIWRLFKSKHSPTRGLRGERSWHLTEQNQWAEMDNMFESSANVLLDAHGMQLLWRRCWSEWHRCRIAEMYHSPWCSGSRGWTDSKLHIWLSSLRVKWLWLICLWGRGIGSVHRPVTGTLTHSKLHSKRTAGSN